jgi:catechol 2,3-dioxygenase-like lactoylglutathione lyase family enzyme
MLSEARVLATIAVSDIAAGKVFYGEKLGLIQLAENPAGVTYQCGEGSRLFIYQSGTAGTNQATCATWNVTDVEAAVAELKTNGIMFEHYDLPGATLQGDIHVWEGDMAMKTAWFKDPDSNILNVGSM